jgi:hypothetical protein
LPRILLGIDFVGDNWHTARSTVEQWWQFAADSAVYDVALGVSNFCRRKEVLPGSDSITPESVHQNLASMIPADRLAHWTSDIDDQVLTEAVRHGFHAVPLYSQFNYGSIVNRLLLMASARDCQYLVRVDPGTRPPTNTPFDRLMDEHRRLIEDDGYEVVSRRYGSRLALRHMFVRPGLEDIHKNLVQDATGVKIDSQVTGGAMFTQRTPGVPAVCLPPHDGQPTLVWASDDAIYHFLPQTRTHSKMLESYPLPRFELAGKAKSPAEYYRGIVGAIFLRSLTKGTSHNQAVSELEAFIQQLKSEMLDVAKCSQYSGDSQWLSSFSPENLAPAAFLDAIRAGYVNHQKLLPEWNGLVETLSPLIRGIT